MQISKRPECFGTGGNSASEFMGTKINTGPLRLRSSQESSNSRTPIRMIAAAINMNQIVVIVGGSVLSRQALGLFDRPGYSTSVSAITLATHGSKSVILPALKSRLT